MIIIILFVLAAAVLLGGSYYAYRIAFYNPLSDRDKLPSTSSSLYDPYRPEMKRIFDLLKGRCFETVTITSHDGLTLSGRYYHTRDGAPLDIGFHGYRSSPFTDFSGGSELSINMGHNLLLVDQRAHGRSEGRTISFGILERLDVLSWVNFALDRFGPDTQILLYGISMGGATVLMASELDLPQNVKGIIADCPYSSPIDVILHVGKSSAFPNFLIRPFGTLGARIFGGFDLHETTAAHAVEKTQVPILIIHGEADTFVPCYMSDIVAHNPQMVQRITIPGAEHGISLLVDRARYEKTVKEFIEKLFLS